MTWATPEYHGIFSASLFFSNATKELLDQYVRAFEKVVLYADRIATQRRDKT
jgi:hypothetical protein